MNHTHQLMAALVVIGAFLVSSERADAQAAGGKTVRIVVPNPAGGPADLIARLLVDQIGRSQGPTMVVENRPGASSDIGTEAVSRAAPDGNTLLMANNNLVITKHIRPSLSFDPMTSFEPMCLLVNVPLVIVVNSSSPYRSLSDLLAAARARPGMLTIGAFGPASSPHIAEESLKRTAQVDWTYVPFPGDAPAVTALLGGHVTALVATYSGVMEHSVSGKLRVLATTGRQRIAALQNVPTIAEYGRGTNSTGGYNEFDVSAWIGLVAPARTPTDQIEYLSRLFASALQTPELTAKLLAQGLYPDGTCGAPFATQLKKDYQYYGRVIREAKIEG
jgi:tripartite-type tricarboxylate transporter receptor subunit TctC